MKKLNDKKKLLLSSENVRDLQTPTLPNVTGGAARSCDPTKYGKFGNEN